MTLVRKRILQIAIGAAIFIVGVTAGRLHASSAAVVNHFGQPKTVLHVVIYKFRDNVSNNDREIAINGIKGMAGKIPGIKNIWLKTERNAADYAESKVHEAWSKQWQAERENSLSFQISNP